MNDCSSISFGTIPGEIINSLKDTKIEYLNNKADIEQLEDSCNKAMRKAQSFRLKPSKYGIKQSKKLIAMDTIHTHPLFMNTSNLGALQDDIERQDFLSAIKKI